MLSSLGEGAGSTAVSTSLVLLTAPGTQTAFSYTRRWCKYHGNRGRDSSIKFSFLFNSIDILCIHEIMINKIVMSIHWELSRYFQLQFSQLYYWN